MQDTYNTVIDWKM